MAVLVRHIKSAIVTYGHDCIELEWRLGHRQGRFRPGVGVDAWRRLQHALDTSPHFQRSFTDTVERMGDAPGVKCITDLTSGGGETWMHKQRLADVDDDSLGPWSVRASVSLEEPDAAPAIKAFLKYERKKQRWSYRHRCWRIDLTRVSSNLPCQLDEDRETHEVEIELADQDVLFEKPVDYVVEWGWSLARDMCELMSGARSGGSKSSCTQG